MVLLMIMIVAMMMMMLMIYGRAANFVSIAYDLKMNLKLDSDLMKNNKKEREKNKDSTRKKQMSAYGQVFSIYIYQDYS